MPTIADLRKAYGADANNRSDEELLSAYASAAGLSPQQAAAQFGYNPTSSGKWGSRFSSAVDRAQGSLYGVAEAAGAGDWARRGRVSNEYAGSVGQERARNQGAVFSYKDVGSIGDAADYVGGLAVDTSPQLAATAVGGAVGGLPGAIAANYGFAVGDVLDAQREQAGKTDLLSAAALGVPYAAVDALTGVGGKLARRALPVVTGGGTVARVAKGAAKGAIAEGAGETFQEGMNQLGRMAVDESVSLTDPDAIERYKESFIGGAALGGVTGGFHRSDRSNTPAADTSYTPAYEPTFVIKEPKPAPEIAVRGEAMPVQQFIDGRLIAPERDMSGYEDEFAAAADAPTGRLLPGQDWVERPEGALESLQRSAGLTPDSPATAAAADAISNVTQAKIAQAAQVKAQEDQQAQLAAAGSAPIRARAAVAQDKVQRLSEEAKSYGVTLPKALDTFITVSDLHASGVLSDEQFADMAGRLAGAAPGLGGVRKDVNDAVKAAKAKAEVMAGIEAGKAKEASDAVAAVKAPKTVTVGRTGREETLTKDALMARMKKASPRDKLLIAAVLGGEYAPDASGNMRILLTGQPRSYGDAAQVVADAMGGKALTPAGVAQVLKRYGIDEAAITAATGSTANTASEADLGIAPGENAGFREEATAAAAAAEGVVQGKALTSKQKALVSAADALLAEAPTTTAAKEDTSTAEANNARVVDERVAAILADPFANEAALWWDGAPWSNVPDAAKADWITYAYAAKLQYKDLSKVPEQVWETEQTNLTNEYGLNDVGSETAARDGGAEQPARKEDASDSEGGAGPSGSGSYSGETGARSEQAAPAVTVKKKRKIEGPKNIERVIRLATSGEGQRPRATSLKVRLRSALKQYEAGDMTAEALADRAAQLMRIADTERDSAPVRSRNRGADFIRQKLLEAKRRGELSDQAVDLAEWFILRNPALLDDLGISVRTNKTDNGVSGNYNPLSRVITLFKDSANDETAVHEILHHLERLMPRDMQRMLQSEWIRQLVTAADHAAKGTDEALRTFYQDLMAFHLEGDQRALSRAEDLLMTGRVGYEHYQMMNPSEFWAVNASRIVEGRYQGTQGLAPRIRQWLRELVERVKSLLGLKSDMAVIRALNSLAKADGTYQSNMMLGEGRFNMYVGKKAQDQAQRDALATAVEMDDAGFTVDQIQRATGWFKNPYDKQWRREIADNNAEFSKSFERWEESKVFAVPTTYRLGDVLDHDQLFAEYPAARDIVVLKRPGFLDFGKGLQGSFDGDNTIQITPYAEDPLSTLLHEIQHWVQKEEGFARGGNTDMVLDLMSDTQRQRIAAEVVSATQEKLNASVALGEAFAAAAKWPLFDEYMSVKKDFIAAFKANADYDTRRPLRDRTDALEANLKQHLGVKPHDYTSPEFSAYAAVTGGVSSRTDIQGRIANVTDTINKLYALLQSVQSGDPEALKEALKGTSTAYKLYRAIAGEIEARDTQARQGLSASDREALTPYTSEEFDPEDVLVTYGDTDSAEYKNIERVPQVARATSSAVKTLFKDAASKGKLLLSFTEDLARMAQASMPSTKKYIDLVRAANVEKTHTEREIDKVLDGFNALTAEERGTGAKSVNRFLMDSTLAKKWGYQPEFQTAEETIIDPDMKRRFDAMSEDARKVIRSVFSYGNYSLLKLRETIVDNVRSEFDAQLAVARAQGDLALEAELSQQKLEAAKTISALAQFNVKWPYAPLKRFGNEVVLAMSKAYLDAEQNNDRVAMRAMQAQPEHYHVEFHETRTEARAARAKIEASGRFGGGLVDNFNRDDDHGKFYGGRDTVAAFARLRRLVNETADSALASASQRAINRMMNDLHISLLGETSARKVELNRVGVAGADTDMMRAFVSQGRNNANFIASLKSSGRITEALLDMKKEADARTPGREQRRDYFNELMKRHVAGMDYQPSPIIDKAMKASSVYMLLTSPAYFFLNATQPFVMSLPVLAAKKGHGYARTTAAMLRAYNEIFHGVRNGKLPSGDYTSLPSDVRDQIKALADRGVIEIMLDKELGDWRSADQGVTRHFTRVMKGFTDISQKVESLNRVATAITAIRLARENGATEAAQLDAAAKVIYETHGDYTAFNAPRAMRTPMGRLLTQFRKFQLIQLSLFARMAHDAFSKMPSEERLVARKALAWSLGNMFVLGGALGMPGAQAIGWVIGQVFGDDDEPDNQEATLRALVGGGPLADLLVKGAPAAMGVDLSGRIGAGGMLSILPYADPAMDRKGYESTLTQAAGPFFGGMLPRVWEGVGLIAKGDYWRGSEQLLPKGFSDVSKAIRFAEEGITQKNGDVVLAPDELGFLDIMSQAIGLPSTTITDRSFKASYKFKMDEFYKTRSSELKQAYVRAYHEGDGEALMSLRQEWHDTQQARQRHGYKVQPLSELLKAPQEQRKRQENTTGGIQFRAGQRAVADELGELM